VICVNDSQSALYWVALNSVLNSSQFCTVHARSSYAVQSALYCTCQIFICCSVSSVLYMPDLHLLYSQFCTVHTISSCVVSSLNLLTLNNLYINKTLSMYIFFVTHFSITVKSIVFSLNYQLFFILACFFGGWYHLRHIWENYFHTSTVYQSTTPRPTVIIMNFFFHIEFKRSYQNKKVGSLSPKLERSQRRVNNAKAKICWQTFLLSVLLRSMRKSSCVKI